jgi:hypothetical protein
MTPHAVRRTSAGLLAAALLLLVTACGDDDGSDSAGSDTASGTPSTSESASPSPSSDAPDCATIWVEGQTLDRRYQGCAQDGVTVAVEKVGCSSGQTFVLFNDEFWAVKGGIVKHAPDGLAASKAYREDMAACRG